MVSWIYLGINFMGSAADALDFANLTESRRAANSYEIRWTDANGNPASRDGALRKIIDTKRAVTGSLWGSDFFNSPSTDKNGCTIFTAPASTTQESGSLAEFIDTTATVVGSSKCNSGALPVQTVDDAASKTKRSRVKSKEPKGARQHRVWLALGHHDRPLSMREVAEEARVDRAYASRLLSSLLKSGEVERSEHGYTIAKYASPPKNLMDAIRPGIWLTAAQLAERLNRSANAVRMELLAMVKRDQSVIRRRVADAKRGWHYEYSRMAA